MLYTKDLYIIENMGDDIFLAPEITMREEPGHIRVNQGGGVAVEIDDDEPVAIGGATRGGLPFGAGEIPPEISITKVHKSHEQQLGYGRNTYNMTASPDQSRNSSPFLKVRSDLGMPTNIRPLGFTGVRPIRPPPLLRVGGLPPMPRLKFGGPSRPVRSTNPLAGMINMIPPGPVVARLPPPPIPPLPPLPNGRDSIITSSRRAPTPSTLRYIQPGPCRNNPNNGQRHVDRPPVSSFQGPQRSPFSRTNDGSNLYISFVRVTYT